MATNKSTTALETPLREQLDRLAAFEPGAAPVISLYLDLRADQHGQRSHVDTFLRQSVDEQVRSLSGEQRAAFDAAAQRIRTYVNESLPKSSAGAAIFASTDGGLFEAIPFDVPVE